MAKIGKINKPMMFDNDDIKKSFDAMNIAHGNRIVIEDLFENINSSIRILSNNKKKMKKDNEKIISKKANSKLIENILGTNFLSELINYDNKTFKEFSMAEVISDNSETIKKLKKVSTGENVTNDALRFVKGIAPTMGSKFGRYGKYQSQSHDTLFNAMKRVNDIYTDGGKIFSYDLETLGGTNNAGHNQVDFITEIGYSIANMAGVGKKPVKANYKTPSEYEKAIKSYNKKAFLAPESSSYSTIIGITEKEADDLKNLVKGFRGADDSSLKNVYTKRLSMMANEDMILDMSDDMFEVAIKDTGNTTDVSIDRALKGIERMREIGRHQEKYSQSIGMDFEQLRKNKIEDFQELVTTGYNKNIGIDLRDNGVVLGHNIFDFDNNAFQQVTGKSFKINEDLIFDTLQITKNIENVLGKGTAIPKGINLSNKFGMNTQDALVYALSLVEEGQETHNAGVDSLNRIKSLFMKTDTMQNSSFTHMLNQMYSAENILKDSKSVHEHTGRKGVFLNHQGGSTANAERNALSFVYHPEQNKIKFANGEVIKGENGIEAPTDEQLNQFVLKKNGIYTSEQFELDINSKMFNEMIESVQDGNDKYFNRLKGVNRLYVQRIEEYIDPEVAKSMGIDMANRPVIYRVSTNQAESYNEMTKIGYMNADGSMSPYAPKGSEKDSILESLKYGEAYKDKDGVVKYRAVDDPTTSIMNKAAVNNADSVTRGLRGGDNKILRAKAFRDNNNGVKLAKAVSDLVSTNKLQEYSAGEGGEALFDLLGYTFNKKKQIATSAIPNLEMIENIYDMYNPAIEALESAGIINTKEAFREVESKVDYNIMTKANNYEVNTKNRAALSLLDKEIDKAVLNPANEDIFKYAKMNQAMSKDDFMVVDILKNDVFNKQYFNPTSGTAEDFFRVNLNSPNSMLKTFYNNRYGTIPDADMKGKEGYSALMDMIEYIKSDARFKDAEIIPKHLSQSSLKNAVKKDFNIVQIASDIQNNVKKFIGAQENIAYGMMYDGASVNKVDAKAREEISRYLSDNDNLNSIINNVKKGMAKNELSGSKVSTTELADQISKHMLNINEKELSETIKNSTGEMRDILLNQYSHAKKDVESYSMDLANALISSGAEIAINDNAILVNGGKGFRPINTHRFSMQNGQIYTNIGKNKYNYKLGISVQDGIKNTPLINGSINLKDMAQVKSSSWIAREGRSINGMVRRAVNDGHEDVTEVLERAVRGINSNIVQATSLIQGPSFVENIQSNLKMSYDEIYKILPDLWESGSLDKMMSKNFSDGNKEIHKKIMQEAMDRLKKNVISKEGRRITKDDINSKEMLAIYRSYFLGLVDEMTGIDNGEKSMVINGETFKYNGATKNLNMSLKSTAIESNELSIANSNSYSPYSKFENHMRDPIYQGGNALKYSKEEAKEFIDAAKANGLNAYVSTEDIVTSDARELYDSYYSTTHRSGVALKTFNGNNDSIRSIMVSDVENAIKGGKSNTFYNKVKKEYPDMADDEIKKIAKELAIKSQNISTYEGQTFIDSRIADAFFGNVNERVIKAGTMTDLTNDIDGDPLSSKIMPVFNKEGKLILTNGAYVDERTSIGMFGENSVIKKTRGDSWVTGRYYNKDGTEASKEAIDKEVKSIISSLEIKSKNMSEYDQARVFKELENVFDFNIKATDIKDNGSVKIMKNATEKSTATSLKLKLGSIDKTLISDLEKVGVDKRLLKQNEALSANTIKVIENQIMSGASQVEAAELITRIQKERHLISSSVFDIEAFKKNGIGMIGLDNTKKHNTVSAPLSNLQRSVVEYNEDIGKDFIKAMYGLSDNDIVDDKINLTGSNKVSLESNDFKTFMSSLDEDIRKDLQGIIDDSGLIDRKGDIASSADDAVGHIAYQEVFQIKDDKGGTYSSWKEKESILDEIKSIDKTISKIAKDMDGLEEGSEGFIKKQAQINGLLNMKNAKDAEIEKLSLDKGLKFNERMNLNLSQSSHNVESYNLMKENVGGTKFGKTMYEKATEAYTDSEGRILKKFEGRAMAGDIVNKLKKDVNLSHGETTLKKAYASNPEKYGNIVSSYKGDINEISAEQAERLYGIKSGEVALRYNSMSSYDDDFIKETMGNGWKLIDPSIENHELFKLPEGASNKIITDIGGQASVASSMEFNPYNKNMVIKTGLSGEDAYIFSSAMPEKVFEDSEIKAKHIGMLGRLQDQIKDFAGDQSNEERLRATINEFKDGQKEAIFGKKGLLGQSLEQRMGMSFSGKASGFTPNEIINGASSTLPVSFNDAIHKAQFMGESVASHISNGIMVDATFMGESAFESIGYFDKGRMTNLFKDMNNEDMLKTAFGENYDSMISKINKAATEGIDEELEAEMRRGTKNLLSTYGDAAVTTRFPNIMSLSDKPSMVYLNDSLQHNQIQQISYTGMSAKTDYDGDNFFAALLQTERGSGNTYLTALGNGSDEAMVNSVNLSLFHNASTSNRHWLNKTRAHEQKMDKVAKEGIELNAIAKNRFVNSELNARFEIGTEWGSHSEVTEAIDNFVSKGDNYAEFLGRASSESPDAIINELKSNNFFKTEEELNDFSRDFGRAFSAKLYVDEITAKTSKGSIGETNVDAFKTKMLSVMSLDSKASDYDYKRGIIMDTLYNAEEAVISSKSSVDTLLRADRASSWNDNVKAILQNKNKNHSQIKGEMTSWLNDNVRGDVDLGKAWEQSTHFRKMARETYEGIDDSTILKNLTAASGDDVNYNKLVDNMFSDVIDTMFEIGSSADARDAYGTLRHGMANKGTLTTATLRTVLDNSVQKEVFSELDNFDVSGHVGNATKTANTVSRRFKETDDMFRSFKKSQGSKSTARALTGAIMEGAEELFTSSMPKGGLGTAAMGVAGGILFSGFVGGRPRPADAQAMEQNQVYAPMDGNLRFADPSMSSGGNGGYVININARTEGDKGRVAEALQSAISAGIGANVNVTMNIGDEYSNINNREIESAVLAALG